MVSLDANNDAGLTAEQIEQYHQDGYIGPFDAFTEDEAESYWERIQEDVFDTERPDDDPLKEKAYPSRADRHRDSRTLYELFTDDRITTKLSSLYGSDLLLWFSNVWDKSAGSPALEWHQDSNAISASPEACGIVWIALTEAKKDSGCLEFVPGTHDRTLPEVEVPEEEQHFLTKEADPEEFDESEAVPVEADPGDIILFKPGILHRSRPNNSESVRGAVNMAVTPPWVYMDYSNDRMLPELEPMVLSGENDSPLYETMSPP